MIRRRACWGIDFAGGIVHIVRIERHGSWRRLTHAQSLPIAEDGADQRLQRRRLSPAVGRLLAGFLEEQSQHLLDPIFVSIPSFTSRQGNLTVPAVGDRAEQFLSFELHQALPDDFDDWITRTDYQSGRPAHQPVHYYAERRSAVATLVGDLQSTGLPVDGLVPDGIALTRYIDREWPAKGRRLAIQVTQTRTILLYLSDQGPQFRTLPFGLGSRRSRTDLEDFARDVAREHRQALRFFFGNDQPVGIERGVLLSTPYVEELLAAFDHQLGVPLTGLPGPRRLDARNTLETSVQEVWNMGAALGCALAGLSQPAEPFSLIPPPAERRQRRRLGPLAAALLLLTLALLTGHLQIRSQVRRLETELHSVKLPGQWGQQDRWDGLWSDTQASADRRAKVTAWDVALKNQFRDPRKLLTALSSGTAFFRLAACEFQADDDRDRFHFTFEVERGLGGALDAVAQWVETQLNLSVEQKRAEQAEDLLTLTIEASRQRRGSS